MTTGPYASTADTYWAAGWRGVLPLPAKAKKHPPKGYTGEAGQDPAYPEIWEWVNGRTADGNIALRLPAHIIGVDVDNYGDKDGAGTLALTETAHGPLPPTWRTTSRDDGVSGIRLYRVPEGLAWPGEVGPSVDIIQRTHRYIVVSPSIHPEGGTYRWINPEGVVSTTVPDVDDFPPLPDAWVEALTGGQLATHTPRVAVKHAEAVGWIATQEHATSDMCARMEKAVDQHAQALPGSAHNSTRDAVLRVARLAEGGHHGAVLALGAIRAAFIADATNPNRALLGTHRRTEAEAVHEFGDLVTSGVGVVLGDPEGIATCDCYGQITGSVVTTPPLVTDGATALDPMPATAGDRDPDPKDDSPARFKDGAAFILDAPETLPNIWGRGEESLWAEGEALMLCGPPGVGKTTLTGQLVRGLIGLQDKVLGLPVRRSEARVLYLAMDRPAQIARGLRRAFREDERAVLFDRLRFWEGPPPGDVAKHPTVLLSLAQLAEADIIIIDSVKDAAVGLSEDEVAAAYNRARQNCLANGVQVLELHHMVKRGGGGGKPTELADVYGSAWLTAGAGSVVLLWGAAGDPIVAMTHLKQPAAEVGPWRLAHDHDTGTTTIFHEVDILSVVASGGDSGVTPADVARLLFEAETPTDAEKEKARRQLNALARKRLVEKVEKVRDVYAGGKNQTYYRVINSPVDTNHGSNHGTSAETANHDTPRPTTVNQETAGQRVHGSNHANHAAGPTTPIPPSIEGDGAWPSIGTPPKLDCNGCGKSVLAIQIETYEGYCSTCHAERKR